VTDPRIHVGRTFGRYDGRVDADAAVAYARATNDVYERDGAVPPLYTVSLLFPAWWEAQHEGSDPGAVRHASGAVHGKHDVYFWNPVRPGMAVQWRSTVHSAVQTPGGVQVTQRILVSDVEGSPLVEHFWSTFHVGGRIEADLGPELEDHSFPAGGRSHPVGNQTFEVTRDQPFRYAGVSQDHAPHAVDEEAAHRDGFPTKILQGMCTFAMCSGALVKIGADGDPDRLRRLAGRFSAPAFPRQPLLVEVYDAGRTKDGGRAFAFEASQNGVAVMKHGRAELVPD
jgi:acyl dehydratase